MATNATSVSNMRTRTVTLSVKPSAAAGPATESVEGTAEKESTTSLALAFVAVTTVPLAAWAASHAWGDAGFKDLTTSVSHVEGLTIFAVFFVAATALERFLEPLASLLGNKTKTEAATAKGEAQVAVDNAASTQDQAGLQSARAKVATAAGKIAAKDVAMGNRKIAFWLIATLLAIFASANMKIYMLTTVGIAQPSRFMEILATGLIIGGGTQPLHNLVELISAKKEATKAAAP